MCTRQSRKVIWDMINTLFLTLQLSHLLLLLSFHLALANISPWPLLPFFQICLQNSELKTTHNTFQDCCMPVFRQPFYLAGFFNTLPPNRPLPKNATIAFFWSPLFFLLALPIFLCQWDFQAYWGQRKVCLAPFHPNGCKFRQVRFQKLAGYTQHLRWQQLENS